MPKILNIHNGCKTLALYKECFASCLWKWLSFYVSTPVLSAIFIDKHNNFMSSFNFMPLFRGHIFILITRNGLKEKKTASHLNTDTWKIEISPNLHDSHPIFTCSLAMNSKNLILHLKIGLTGSNF